MFRTDENIFTLPELQNQLIEARKKLERQEKSLQLSAENIRHGGSSGILPPHLQQAILDSYKKDVQDLENRIKELNLKSLKDQLLEAKNQVTEQENSISMMAEITRKGGRGGIVPPYMTKSILDHYKDKVQTLEKQIKTLESGISEANPSESKQNRI